MTKGSEQVVESEEGHDLEILSEDALALRFASNHGNRAKFVAAWGKWFFWDGARWREDRTLRALELARQVCRSASTECYGRRKEKEGITLSSAKTAYAIMNLARADPRLAATVEQWDVDPWSLNTPDGVVNLRLGELTPHRHDAYMTKITAVAPGGDYPMWSAFLHRVTNGDRELQTFLQLVAGYSLTGMTSAHALFFLYGTGANGKSVFINTLAGILGDYAVTAAIETFTASNTDRHPTELARLTGARLVIATETEEGRRWAEARIKTLTGGDKISARFMHKDYFEYMPQFKLLIAGNHRPALRNVDEAIRRRMHLIPFLVKIPPEERDEKLAEKLQSEWPGILQWAIDGCLAWQAEGLSPPDAVRSATDEYLNAEDVLGEWLAERCVIRSGRCTSCSDLYGDFRQWVERTGEAAWTQKRFSQVLSERGFNKRRQGGQGRVLFDGISLQIERESGPWS
jgi:putative DNA primase/helicase